VNKLLIVFTVVKLFIKLVKFLIPGADIFYNKLCQDTLENHFGQQQQQRGRTHEKPNAYQFSKNAKVINSTCSTIQGGQKSVEIENTPLRQTKKVKKGHYLRVVMLIIFFMLKYYNKNKVKKLLYKNHNSLNKCSDKSNSTYHRISCYLVIVVHLAHFVDL